ncbi:keratin, type I cuticular Ha8-like [Enhydra lutris kenyoni]|uniref:Keratin, type I cuticular Ha8-like n=1 Tax=Enhydra lutris kenyoni TaxID=391180 RepID=A0A2Y9JVT0_ENHLU|nr:keratin, type I cuticular Ha8-like [Enhydra lutris kenyoni]
MGYKRPRRKGGCQTQWLDLSSCSQPSVQPQPNTMTSCYISSSQCPGSTRLPAPTNVYGPSIDIVCQPGAEARAASLCLSATMAHANRARVGATPLGKPSLCMPFSCRTACPLPGTCNIPGNIGVCENYAEGAPNGHEKVTMQFLNDRLANYLEKVRQLERDNEELETKIRESSKCHESTMCPDYQSYFQTIEELQQKILCSKAENTRLIIQVDNAKLAADDFRIKHESELSLRQMVEADMCGMHKLMDDLSLAKADLEAQQESLKEELLCLKKNHEQEGVQMGSSQWTTGKTFYISARVVAPLKRTVNALEVELQAQHSLKDCLQNSLCEADARFGTELAQMQVLISNVEEQLSEIRGDLERQNQEYQVLLDVKARLECEIATYRKLLESEDCKLPCNPCSTSASCVTTPCTPRPSCAPCNTCVPGPACGTSTGSRF